MKEIAERLIGKLVAAHGVAREAVRVVRSPYRICPLGAHIDHQLGPVTAMAIDRGVLLAFAPSASPTVHIRSESFPGEVRFSLDAIGPKRDGDWGNYARGAARALREQHDLRSGIVGITSGGLGEGGLSSSAAVGVAYLLALEQANGLHLTARENIVLDRQIENAYLGLRIGVLDQSAILLSRRDHLTVIDCNTLDHRLIARPRAMPLFEILVAFSGLQEALVRTDYNLRVDECRAAARALLAAAGRPAEPALLGNVRAEEYDALKSHLTGPPARRARHFFGELARVEAGVRAWEAGNTRTFGQLMTASGESSIRNYQCGCPPLVDLYETLIRTDGVHGARFSGAGFRGCCVALVDPNAAAAAATEVRRKYAERQPELAADAMTVRCHSADGAGLIDSGPWN